MTFDDMARHLVGLGISPVAAIGNPKKVWCRTCGESRPVDAGQCLRSGWPKCCGYTMTIDDPKDPRAPWRSDADRALEFEPGPEDEA